MPVALALTAGIVTDRYYAIPLAASLIVVVAALVAWSTVRVDRQPGLAFVYLGMATVAFGSGYHHWRHTVFAANDIGCYASVDPRPARVRGVLAEEPVVHRLPADDPLRSFRRQETTQAVLRLSSLKQQKNWTPASGLAQLTIAGRLTDLHVGDEVEVVGRLAAPSGPANPGERDLASALLDRRIRARLLVRQTPRGVTRLEKRWPLSLHGWLGMVRAWGRKQLEQALPPQTSGVAVALLLGEGSAMSERDWDRYKRTGVVHVLAISGLHLVVLAGFLWWVLRLVGIRRRRGAWLVALLLLLYALLTGSRPPIMRSAVTVCACCGALYLRRPVLSGNTLALAWITVALLNPAHVFDIGCQLSFLAVAVLYWGCGRWMRSEMDPLEQLIEKSRPSWQKAVLWLTRLVGMTYAATIVVWLAQAPLVAAHTHLVSPIGMLIGPPAVVVASVALISGFLLLLAAAICSPLVPLFASVTDGGLVLCNWLVHVAGQVPGGHWYVADIPTWWLCVFYVALLAVLAVPAALGRWRWIVLAGLVWICVGLGNGWGRLTSDGLRCTFLAVGHGGCTVLETPNGRTLLYDSGAQGGPDVTRRQIAPFLWSRGIRRIDEVFLSHADLDHFNGLADLLDRFAVGRVTCTPTFADKSNRGVQMTLAALHQHRIPVRVIRAGVRLVEGDLEMTVLHPPGQGPEGNENARSMVLLLRHAGHSMLLTGDLEGPGLEQVLHLPPVRVDVLMAPHHGSKTANTSDLADWARPQVVIASQGPPEWPTDVPDIYDKRGAMYLGTWPHGAITIRSREGELVIETFQTGQRLVLQPRQKP